MSKQELSLKGTVDLERAIGYLEDLIASLKAGTVHIQQGDKGLTIHPRDVVDLEVEVEQKKAKEKFTIELAWRNGVTTPTDGDLVISSEAPEPVEEDEETDETVVEEVGELAEAKE